MNGRRCYTNSHSVNIQNYYNEWYYVSDSVSSSEVEFDVIIILCASEEDEACVIVGVGGCQCRGRTGRPRGARTITRLAECSSTTGMFV